MNKTHRPLTASQLQDELKKFVEDAQKKNPAYSIRALARKLGVVDSTLQKVFSGRRKLGVRLAREIATQMNVEIVNEPVKRREHHRHWKLKLNSDSEFETSWLNLTILEMIKLKDFVPLEGWVARRLGLPIETIQVAIQQMEKHGMLQRTETGAWIDCMADASSGAHGYQSTTVIRRMLKDIVSLSGNKIETTPYELREHAFSITPIAKSQLPLLKKKIQQFNWELCEMAQNAKQPKDEIYTLQVGFFPMTDQK